MRCTILKLIFLNYMFLWIINICMWTPTITVKWCFLSPSSCSHYPAVPSLWWVTIDVNIIFIFIWEIFSLFLVRPGDVCDTCMSMYAQPAIICSNSIHLNSNRFRSVSQFAGILWMLSPTCIIDVEIEWCIRYTLL